MQLKIDLSMSKVDRNKGQKIICSSLKHYDALKSRDMQYSGWVNLPLNLDANLSDAIKKTAEVIKKQCTLFVVVGIGGSFLGAKAVIDALNKSKPDYPEIIFAGYSMSAAFLKSIADRMNKEATCLCVISKSGKTVEPLLAYSILKEVMYCKYGTIEASKRIYIVTDKSEGVLREEVNQHGYCSFEIPNNIGGRYSVLTPVGLFPIAVAGHDIELLLGGAKAVTNDTYKNDIISYVTTRNILHERGKTIEIFEYFEANLRYFGEWLKQLFAESEGKGGKGVYPTCLCFSRDLHSMGQFLQQGSQVFYETMIRVEKPNFDFVIPNGAGKLFAGKTLEQINACSEDGVIKAHSKGGIPIVLISIPEINEYTLGELIYFFEMSCAISAMNNGVNPFDQPGVEAYKSEMKELVEKLYG